MTESPAYEMIVVSKEDYQRVASEIKTLKLIDEVFTQRHTNPAAICYNSKGSLLMRVLIWDEDPWDFLFPINTHRELRFHIREDLYERYCKQE